MSVTPPFVYVMVYVESYFDLPYVKCLHFVGLKCSCHFSDHHVSLLISSCKNHFTSHICVNFGVISKGLNFSISSIWQVVYEEYGAQRMLPLGISLVTSDHSDGLPFTNTLFIMASIHFD